MVRKRQRDKSTPFIIIAFFLFFSLIILTFAFLGRKTDACFMPKERAVFSYPERPTVIIDAGHGGEDGGAVGVDGSYEKDINLDIALYVEEILSSCGIDTVLTRDTDILLYDKGSDYEGHKKQQDLETRKQIAQQYENAVFVSIHMNSFSDGKYRGLQVYYSPNNDLSALLADKVQNFTKESLMSYNHRKIKKADSSIFLLRELYCPAILIECGFLSNTEDCALFASEEYRDKLSFCIAASVLDFLSD